MFYLTKLLLLLIHFYCYNIDGASLDKEIALSRRNLHETKNQDGSSILHHKENERKIDVVNVTELFKNAQNCPAPKENSIMRENGKWNVGTKEFTSKKLILEMDDFDCLVKAKNDVGTHHGGKIVLKKCADLVQVIVCFGHHFKTVRISTVPEMNHLGLRSSNFPPKFFANLAIHLAKATPTFVSNYVEFTFGLQEDWPRFGEVGMKPHKKDYNAIIQNPTHVNKPQLFWEDEDVQTIKYTMETMQLDAHEDETHQTYFIEINSKSHDLKLHKMSKLKIYRRNDKMGTKKYNAKGIQPQSVEKTVEEDGAEDEENDEERKKSMKKLQQKQRDEMERKIAPKNQLVKTPTKHPGGAAKGPVKIDIKNEKKKFDATKCPTNQTIKIEEELKNATLKAKKLNGLEKKPVRRKTKHDYMIRPIFVRNNKTIYRVVEGNELKIEKEIIGRYLDDNKGRHVFWTHNGKLFEEEKGDGHAKIESTLSDTGWGKWTELTIKKAKLEDQGRYVLAVKNNFGTDCIEVMVFVTKAPALHKPNGGKIGE